MTRDEYIAALKAHDWHYEWSDDHRYWKRGSEQRRALETAQPSVDPDLSLWNTHCPAQYERTPA